MKGARLGPLAFAGRLHNIAISPGSPSQLGVSCLAAFLTHSSQSFKSQVIGLFEPNDRKWVFLTVIGAILAGLVFPFWGATFSVMIDLLFRVVYKCDDADIDAPREPEYPQGLGSFGTCANYYEVQSSDMESDSHRVLGYWAGLGACSLLGYTLLLGAGGKVAENLSKRVRDCMFQKLLSLEVKISESRRTSSVNL